MNVLVSLVCAFFELDNDAIFFLLLPETFCGLGLGVDHDLSYGQAYIVVASQVALASKF